MPLSADPPPIENHTEALTLSDPVFNVAIDPFQNQEKNGAKQSYDLLKLVCDASLMGMAVHQAVYDLENNILDFRIIIVNKELEGLTSRTDPIGKLYSQAFPDSKMNGCSISCLRSCPAD